MSGVIADGVIRSQAQNTALRALASERLFYVFAGSLMLVATALGFRGFLAHGKALGGREITRQIVPLVVVHGLAMFSWIVLFLVQSVFILKGHPRLHMRIGVGGALLASAIVPLGSVSAILSARYNPELYQFFGGPRFFLAIMLGEMFSFGVLVGVAIIYRRRPEIHRPTMLLASLMIISASLGRCPYIGQFARMPPLYVLGPSLALGALFLLLQWRMTRALSRWYAFGYTAFVTASCILIVIGHSDMWNQIAGRILHT